MVCDPCACRNQSIVPVLVRLSAGLAYDSCVFGPRPRSLEEIIDRVKKTMRSTAAIGGLSRLMVIALAGQSSWQQKQRMQPLRSTRGLPESIAMTLAGQCLAHKEQPVQA